MIIFVTAGIAFSHGHHGHHESHGSHGAMHPVAAVSYAAGPSLSTDSRIVATVGSEEIKGIVLRRALAGSSLYEVQSASEKLKTMLRHYLDNAIIRDMLLAELAKKHGALSNRALRNQLTKVLADAAVRHHLQSLMSLDSVPMQEVQAYYDAHKREYTTPAQVRIAHIMVRSKGEAESLIQTLLKDSKNAGISPEAFGKLAAEKSMDISSKHVRGDLGYVTKDGRPSDPRTRVPKEVVQAAWAAKDGELLAQPVVSPPNHVHVVWRRESLPERVRSIEEESRTIRTLLVELKRKKNADDLLKSLQQKNQVTINSDLLALIKLHVGPRPIPSQRILK